MGSYDLNGGARRSLGISHSSHPARRLLDADQTVHAPSHPREPCARARDRRRLGSHGGHPTPAVEPTRRRPRIHSAGSGDVFLHVRQDVHEGVADLARSSKDPRVVSITPYGAVSTERPVASSRGTDRQSLDTPCEPSRFVRLDEKMHVVALNRILQNPERIVRGGCQRGRDRSEHGIRAERRQVRACSQRHMDRATWDMRTACAVRDATSPGCGLPPGAVTRAAPSALPKREAELSTTGLHLIRQ